MCHLVDLTLLAVARIALQQGSPTSEGQEMVENKMYFSVHLV